MTNEFKAAAAKYNFYTIDNIPFFYFEDEHFKNRFNFESEKDTRMVIPETLKQCKFEFGIFAEIKEEKNNDGSHRLFYTETFKILLFDGCNVVQLTQYKRKYYLHPMYKDINATQGGLSYSQIKPYTSKIEEPNRIGVFTNSKLSAWFDYCRKYMQALTECRDNHGDKTTENLKRIADVESALNTKALGYSTYKYIKLKNMEIRFELSDNGAFMTEQVIFTGGVDAAVNMLNNLQK